MNYMTPLSLEKLVNEILDGTNLVEKYTLNKNIKAKKEEIKNNKKLLSIINNKELEKNDYFKGNIEKQIEEGFNLSFS